MLVLLTLVSLQGCSFLESNEPAATPAAPAAPAPPADPAQGVRDALMAGKFAEALTQGEAALGAKASEDVYWDLVEIAAVRGGQAGMLLDRLQANEAVGGRVDRHFALRGALAIEARRPVDLLAAAKALESAAPGDAAAFTLAAVQAGAAVPPDASPATAALVAWAASPDAPLPPEVAALPGTRAALARARVQLGRGDRAGAALSLEGQAPGSVLLAEAVVAAQIAASTDPAAVWTLVEAGAAKAVDAGDAIGAARLYGAALAPAAGAFRAGDLADAAGKLRAACAEKKNEAAVAELAAVQAEAALRAGRPVVAVEAAGVASQVAATKARGQWALALGSAMLGDAAGVEAAATGLPGVKVRAVQDLASALRGGSPALPSPGLEGADAAFQVLLAAGWLADPGPALRAAVTAAEGAPDLQLWARLWATRGPVESTGAAPGPLAAENAVRGFLQGLPGVGLADTSHPDAAGWNVLLTGTGEPPAGAGPGAWVRLRRAVAKSDAAEAAGELANLAASAPQWRSGPWAPVLALDGPMADELGADGAALDALPDAVTALVVRHSWAQRGASARLRWGHGVSPVAPSVKPDDARAVWAAAAEARVRQLAWVSGAAEWPTEALAALSAAETKAGLKATKPMSLREVRLSNEQGAVWSILRVADGYEVLLVTDEGGQVLRLPASVGAAAAAFADAVRGGSSAIAAGDALRSELVDPFEATLRGVGVYHMVGTDPLSSVPIEAFPEQRDGIRFLSSIRRVVRHPDFESLLPGDEPSDATYTGSMVAVLGDAEDPARIKQLFPDAVVLTGAAATRDAWRAAVPTARFIHFGRLTALPDGGVVLPSGERLTLADVARSPLTARVVLLEDEVDPTTSIARVAAFRVAGARDVMTVGWTSGRAFHEQLITNFWDRSNRRYGAIRSFVEARNEAVKMYPEATGPSWWAGYRLGARK